MKRADVIIFGAGWSEEKDLGREFSLPGSPETLFKNLIHAFSDEKTVGKAKNSEKSSGQPRFTNPHTVLIDGEEWTAPHFVINSGCKPFVPKEFKGEKFLLPLEALKARSKSAMVIGAGPIGVATAAALARKNVNVTLSSRHTSILRSEDPDMATAVQDWLESIGVHLKLQSKDFKAPVRVLATGLIANTEGMDFEKAGVRVDDSGKIAVDEEMRTAAPHIFAMGAVTGAFFNLSLEKFQADVIATNLTAPFYQRKKLFPESIPFVYPFGVPFARVGLTESEARKKGVKISSAVVSDGLWKIKLVGKKKSAELLGATAFGPGAESLILFFDLMMRAQISLREVEDAPHFPWSGLAKLAGQAIQAWLSNSES